MDKILDRIKRLLALTSSNNEHEAAAAAAEAQRLMLKHGIETAQLDAPNASKTADQLTVDTDSMNAWYATLANICAKATFCTVYKEVGAGAGKSAKKIAICGFPGDIAACGALLAWLAAEINRYCETEWAVLKMHSPTLPSANAWKKSFRLGACVTISQRLTADREAVKRETAGTALVHLSTYEKQSALAVTTMLAKRGIRLGKDHAAGAKNMDGFSRGQEAGSRINLNAPKRALAE